jgi:hypothetical protein
MHTRTDEFTGLRGAIARAGLAVVAFGVLTALPLVGHGPTPGAGSVQVAQADTSHHSPVQESSWCEI